MTTETQISDQSGVAFWQEMFGLGSKDMLRANAILGNLKVARSDIWTARLKTTVEFYQLVEAGNLVRLPASLSSLTSVLDIYCLLATADNLARANVGELRAPSFWVRSAAMPGQTRPSPRPAIALSALASLSGISASTIRAALVPLVKDRALEFVRSPDGVVALVVKDGFINDTSFKRYFQG